MPRCRRRSRSRRLPRRPPQSKSPGGTPGRRPGDGMTVHPLLRYRLDLAEIATAQEMPALDTDGDGKVSDAERADYLRRRVGDVTSKLSVSIDGQPAALAVTGSDLQLRPGAADLPTLML